MGKQSRRKRERRREASAESRAFREYMRQEDPTEIGNEAIRRAGFDPAALDYARADDWIYVRMWGDGHRGRFVIDGVVAIP